MEIYWISKVHIPGEKLFQQFVGAMAKRIIAGHFRYGTPKPEKSYKTRMEMEVRAYHKTGNAEFLVNIANYALLESICPQHPKFHWDKSVDSVTRGKV